MRNEGLPYVELAIPAEQFRRLPRHAAYRYEYVGGLARLLPRPRFYHALLDLPADLPQPGPLHLGVGLRPLTEDDWPRLDRPFAAAFEGLQPFGGLDEETRLKAVRHALEHTRTGGDGPLIAAASFVAVAGNEPVGATLVTLIPGGDLTSWDGYIWEVPPPPDCIEQRLGQPHLSWIFVAHGRAGRGVGTALLAESTRALLALGYTDLASTFLLGNESSMLWHWRCGFRLLGYPASPRLPWLAE
jgi:hypothetical protein